MSKINIFTSIVVHLSHTHDGKLHHGGNIGNRIDRLLHCNVSGTYDYNGSPWHFYTTWLHSIFLFQNPNVTIGTSVCKIIDSKTPRINNWKKGSWVKFSKIRRRTTFNDPHGEGSTKGIMGFLIGQKNNYCRFLLNCNYLVTKITM